MTSFRNGETSQPKTQKELAKSHYRTNMNSTILRTAPADVVCGIIGGVGPMAGVKLHEKIISLTDTNGTDQDHLPVHHISASNRIDDRTSFLLQSDSLHHAANNPANGAFQAFRSVFHSVQKVDTKKLVVGVPCNTFHAPLIWSNFTGQIHAFLEGEKGLEVCIVNMIDATVDHIAANATAGGLGLDRRLRVGLMSTEGTRNTRVYHSKFGDKNMDVVCIPGSLQDDLTRAIYDKSFGIKAKSSPVSKTAVDICKQCADWLVQTGGADVVVLGCTELPLALPSGVYTEAPVLPAVDEKGLGLLPKR